jgi:hypothetical protein
VIFLNPPLWITRHDLNMNQHYVTEGYIKAWLDPKTPQGAYVWVFSKKYKTISRKSPSRLFSEIDFYTDYDNKGNRILDLEHELKKIEDKFFLLRDSKLKIHKSLLPDDRLTIATFISSMFARTKFQKEIQVDIWEELLDTVDNMPENISNSIKESAEYKTIKALHKQPMPFNLFNFVNISAPVLYRMNACIYENNDAPGFITSDNPCLWMDPDLIYPSEPKTWFGLGSRKLNVILPISPNQCISLMAGGFDGYQEIDPEYAKIIEELIISQAQEKIVINKHIIKESWL